MRKTILLVFIHGFKGTDRTFHDFPGEIRALLAHDLPRVNVLTLIYPRFETRGDLKVCVSKFKEWLQNKVIDLEVASRAPSPTVNPSVHIILCGHSMGGVVAAETLLSITRDEAVPAAASEDFSSTSEPPSHDTANPSTTLFFPHVRAILAFDTPYLGISPGVLAHGAEEQFNQASNAYKAFDSASQFFGWNTARSPPAAASPAPVEPSSNWGRYAMYGGAAAAALAGVAGAAYLNWNQINSGLSWAGSHLEFVGCLVRGAELQGRVEQVVRLSRTHDVGFANFYTVLGEKVNSRTRYAGAVLGEDRTFCVVPKGARGGPVKGSNYFSFGAGKEQSPSDARSSSTAAEDMPNSPLDEAEMRRQGERVRDFAKDPTKSKGLWVRCMNTHADDEIGAHTTMFEPELNPDYHVMLSRAKDQIRQWVDGGWYDDSDEFEDGGEGENRHTFDMGG